MRVATPLVLAMCAWSAVAVAGTPLQPVAFRAEAKVTLDASGRPLSIEASSDLPSGIRKFVEQRVATWHFSPPERDGITGAAVTYVRLGACALPVEGGYRLAVDLKGNGPRYAAGPRFLPPAYPRSSLVHGVDATMMVDYVVEADGSATLEKLEYIDGKQHGRRDGFEASIREWVGRMRYEPELLAGKPVRTRIRIPVVFTTGETRTIDQMKAERERETMTSSECRMAASEPEMQPMALNSPVKIQPAG